jgi:Nucleotide modification associated domain 3
MPNGLFYRVAVDSASGGWNAPCRTDGSFCYVPISDANPSERGTMFDRSYDEFSPFVTAMGDTWPSTLSGLCHLDPDFAHLTYGDQGSRAARLREFITPGSLSCSGLVFVGSTDLAQARSCALSSVFTLYRTSYARAMQEFSTPTGTLTAAIQVFPMIISSSSPTLANQDAYGDTFLSGSTVTVRSG